ncbi:thiamine ABC transporter ATP-binding protein [Rhizobium sp. SAFR-030]|uniref:thiamine ABC transporter ATP-binding protein n=1 Tax=Rhizobium sp. SAFR-030 TaxID=3387277 RepID=UPI003F821CBC
MSEIPAVELKDVRLRLGTASFHFDCAFPAGEITAITGASGSGKSTLLNLVAGFQTPDEGRVLIGGEEMTSRHPGERPLSVIFQDNNLFAHLDVYANVGLGVHPGLRLDEAGRRRVSSALERVGLAGYERRRPGTLSGGERQRVAFARALVRHRPLLLLDEPFAALDPALRRSMAELLLDLHRETQMTVLVVTHDVEEVKRLADSVIYIADGTIRFQAPKDVFMLHSEDPGIARFVGSS